MLGQAGDNRTYESTTTRSAPIQNSGRFDRKTRYNTYVGGNTFEKHGYFFPRSGKRFSSNSNFCLWLISYWIARLRPWDSPTWLLLEAKSKTRSQQSAGSRCDSGLTNFRRLCGYRGMQLIGSYTNDAMIVYSVVTEFSRHWTAPDISGSSYPHPCPHLDRS